MTNPEELDELVRKSREALDTIGGAVDEVEEEKHQARRRFLEHQYERRQAWRKKNGWASQ